ncbi:MAG: 16S rRNA (cytidine(1402)-2'-O)-methyltransferase [Ruminococcus sp.]|nr:16S rRNA (cytidine(1402)-2'-O)-methyltransferase [Ruminococcus sp.]
MSGTLYIVGTPIGNLEDITLRQLRILGEVDFIAAEDTRVTRKLLNHYEINTPTTSYHEHSERIVANKILERIQSGESCAIVTDAGMPCISDPGEPLIKLCYENNIPVTVVPGPSAIISALALSGQHTARFTFEGFLSVTKKQRISHLEQLKDETRTMIFYEAPHKLLKTLEDFAVYFEADRKLSLCREITKIHEQVLRMNVGEAIEYYKMTPPKGEFVLIVEGAEKKKEKEYTIEEAVAMVEERVKNGEKRVEACKAVAAETGFRKQQLYTR